jgi:O-antigen/teichoic acid export membrane protein
MIERLKSTVRHTFVYSLSNIAPKIVGIILLPLYTAQLSKIDFGNWDLIDITIQILTEILILGQATSLILINNSEEYKDKKGTAFFTLSIFVLLACSLIVFFAEGVTTLSKDFFQNSQIQQYYIRISAYTILLRVMNNLFLSKVRADEQSVFYTIVSVLRVISTTAIAVYLVGFLHHGITGILYAGFLGEFIAIIILLFRAIPQMQTRIDFKILKVGLKFGLPLVLSSVGFMLLNLSDRYVIKFLIGAGANALYGLAYRVAGVLNMFFVLPFSLGLLPIAYKYYGKPDDKRFYSKLMTYSTYFFIWGFIFLSLFCKEIISVFAEKPDYQAAYIVVPVILLSYVFSGMRLTAQLGMMLTKNTKHIAWITIGAAALNIGLNFVFIPVYGITAAAANTLVAFVIFYVITQILSDKHFKIPYENRKLLLLLFIGIILCCPVYFLSVSNKILEWGIKLLLTAIFPIILIPFGFYEKAELEILKSPAKMLSFVKGIFSGAEKSETSAISDIEQ